MKIKGTDLASIAGTWTPVLTGVSNVSATATGSCNFARIGDIIVVSGSISVTPTVALTSTIVGISPPVPSNFVLSSDAGGMAASAGINQSGAIEADVINDRMQMRYISQDNTGRGMFFTAMYRIIP